MEQKKKENKELIDEKLEYNWVIRFGFELSQVTPDWPHKLLATFQIKFPFDVNEL